MSHFDKSSIWNTFPILESPRLILREMDPVIDTPDILKFWGDPIVCQYTDFLFLTKDIIKEVLHHIHKGFQKKERIRWGITLKSSNIVIGTIGFNSWLTDRGMRGEIGYDLHQDYWRQGIMSEALKLVLTHGFQEMRLHRIEAMVDPDNVASASLLKKNGFRYEGILRDYEYFKDAYHSCACYAILSND